LTIESEKAKNFVQHYKVICPYCKKSMDSYCLDKHWMYNQTTVYRYECTCGENFNFYQTKKSSWTIPKHPERGIK
jgi:hypothetical protein